MINHFQTAHLRVNNELLHAKMEVYKLRKELFMIKLEYERLLYDARHAHSSRSYSLSSAGNSTFEKGSRYP
jgi:hypothetical protein